ncbi:tRNA (guanine-N(7)-)-methyltransferase [soil metagenome]|jgi:tRNA (guanine-N7-)-methyltransferase
MPRGKLGRMKVETPDEETARRYLSWLPGERLHHEPETLPRISSQDLFESEAPLELEIGCGTGEFLCHQAESRPGTNFVGVDLHVKSLYRAVSEAYEKDLDNVLFLRADFNLLYPLLASGMLGAAYILFPDPGMKDRQRRRRIFSERFLYEMHESLEPGGRLVAVTDHEEYFAQMMELAERAEGWEPLPNEVFDNPAAKTRFGSLWEGRGRLANELILVRR